MTTLPASGHGSPVADAQDRLPIPVAFLLDEGATVIDFCGPWEVFQDVEANGRPAFQLFTVAPTPKPFRASGGMQLIPDYSFADAPPAKVIVIPAQAGGRDPTQGGAKVEWLKSRRSSTEIFLPVCTGAFLFAKTGFLTGRPATTHHLFFDDFERLFPDVQLVRNRRFIDDGDIVSAGGLSSGIDGALHVVERYLGAAAASAVAKYMEYRVQGLRRG